MLEKNESEKLSPNLFDKLNNCGYIILCCRQNGCLINMFSTKIKRPHIFVLFMKIINLIIIDYLKYLVKSSFKSKSVAYS